MGWLVSRYGGSYFTQTEKRKAFPNAKPTVKYFATGKALQNLIEDIKPFLILKQTQADNLLALLNSQEAGVYGIARPKPQALKDFHENLYLSNKELNSGKAKL